MEELNPYLHLIALLPVQKHYQIQTPGSCHTPIAEM